MWLVALPIPECDTSARGVTTSGHLLDCRADIQQSRRNEAPAGARMIVLADANLSTQRRLTRFMSRHSDGSHCASNHSGISNRGTRNPQTLLWAFYLKGTIWPDDVVKFQLRSSFSRTR